MPEREPYTLRIEHFLRQAREECLLNYQPDRRGQVSLPVEPVQGWPLLEVDCRLPHPLPVATIIGHACQFWSPNENRTRFYGKSELLLGFRRDLEETITPGVLQAEVKIDGSSITGRLTAERIVGPFQTEEMAGFRLEDYTFCLLRLAQST